MSRKIVIEALAVGYPPCGLREFTLQVFSRIARKAHPDVKLTFIVPPGFKGCFGSDVEYIQAGLMKIHALRSLPILKADLFHAPHQLCRVKNLPAAKNRLLTIHDVNFAHTRSGAKYRRSEERFVNRLGYATCLSYISRFAKVDVESRFPNSLPARVIYNGVTEPDFSHAERPEKLPANTGDFLFHLSSLLPYKNPRLLVEMMDYLPDKTLVIAGGAKDDILRQEANKRVNVVMLGSVTNAERTWLYTHCTAFLFPSIAEGFGLPPLEAMFAGKPVFLSTLTSLPEVGGNVAFYWPELEPSAMAKVLVEGLANSPAPESLRLQASQFNWDLAAEAYYQYYLDILGLK